MTDQEIKDYVAEESRKTAAAVMSLFWKNCYPILVGMLRDSVPKAMESARIMQENPWLNELSEDALRDACLKAKSEMPAGGGPDILQRAVEILREAGTQVEDGSTGAG